jgi:hypothetical protein
MLEGASDRHAEEMRAAAMRPEADDEDEREMEMRRYAEGGEIKKPRPAPIVLPDKYKKFQESSMFNDTGKPKKPAVATGYAEGGEIDARDESEEEDSIDSAHTSRDEMMLRGGMPSRMQAMRAASGRASVDDEEGSIAERILTKKKMAEGGEVDLQDNSDEDLNMEDDLSFDAARKKTYYDLDQLDSQPEDSNEHGDELEDEDSHDMVDQIRRKMKSRLR